MTALHGWLALLVSIAHASEVSRLPIFWNLFTQTCYKRNHSLIPLEDYGITFNTDHKFHGDQIVILYEYNFRHYPYYAHNEHMGNGSRYKAINGGLPQKCNLSDFFASAEEIIQKAIPDGNFQGPAILDFEEWRPLLSLNWNAKSIYKAASEDYVRQRFPDLSEKAVKVRAEVEFDKAAGKMLVGLLLLAKQLRPSAKWGFYLYPYCNLGALEKKGALTCTNWIHHNDQLNFIYEHQTGLFPSVYFNRERNDTFHYHLAQIQLREARRIALSMKTRPPIYMYSKFEYDPAERPGVFYRKEDLCSSVQTAMDEGANGVIMWSTSKNMKARCDGIAGFVRKTLGSVVQNTRRKAKKCSEKHCSGRGVCVRTGEIEDKCKWSMKSKSYACLCDEGYAGAHCEKSRPRWYKKKKLRRPSYVKSLPFTIELSAEQPPEEVSFV